MWTTDQSAVRGTALLAVLWLSAALAAIALSLADTVRGEAERSATAVDGLREQHLAEGALERAILYMDWGRKHPDNPRFKPPTPYYPFEFPEGQAVVEVIPETAKYNINTAIPEDLFRLLVALGVQPARAEDIVAAIVDWRTPAATGPTAFDAFYQTLRPPYVSSHAPFQEIEELLEVRGITPDLFYGTWQTMPEGWQQHMFLRNGLRDCVSIFGTSGQFDINSAAPAVLAAVGVPPEGVAAIVRQRGVRAFHNADDMAAFASIAGPGFLHLRIGGNSIFTLRSTARVRLVNGQLSDMRRTVAALVKLMPAGYDAPFHILRWYDSAVGQGSGTIFPELR